MWQDSMTPTESLVGVRRHFIFCITDCTDLPASSSAKRLMRPLPDGWYWSQLRSHRLGWRRMSGWIHYNPGVFFFIWNMDRGSFHLCSALLFKMHQSVIRARLLINPSIQRHPESSVANHLHFFFLKFTSWTKPHRWTSSVCQNTAVAQPTNWQVRKLDNFFIMSLGLKESNYHRVRVSFGENAYRVSSMNKILDIN